MRTASVLHTQLKCSPSVSVSPQELKGVFALTEAAVCEYSEGIRTLGLFSTNLESYIVAADD